MQDLHMYLCDVCGYAKDQPAMCRRCHTMLTEYTKETQAEYQVNMEEPMRSMSELKWYL